MSVRPAALDLSVYLVTEPMAGLDDVVAAAVGAGVGVVQLRDKTASTRARVEAAGRLRTVTTGRGVPLVVDDDLEAARAADGIHVGVRDLSPVLARALLGPDALVGWSVNHPDQLEDHEAVEAASYLAVSPVWATGTKPDHEPPLGLDGVRAVVGRVAGRRPVVGIGGIDGSNAGSVVSAGAAGVAVVSAVTRAPDVGAAVRTLRAAVEQGRTR